MPRKKLQSKISSFRYVFPGNVRRALIVLAAVALVPVVAIQAYIYYAWYNVRVSEEIRVEEEIARSVSSSFDAFVRDISRQESALGMAIASLHPFSVEQANRFLARSVKLYSSVSSFQWADPHGDIISASDIRFIGIHIGDRQYFRDVVEGNDLAVSDLLSARATGENIIVIAQAVRDDKGILQGAVLGAIVPERLGLRAIVVQHPRDGFVALFDRKGNVVFHRPALALPARNWKDRDPLLARGLAGEAVSGTSISPVMRELAVTACVPVPNIGWAAEASRSRGSMLAPIRKTLFFNIGMLLMVMLASFLLALGITAMIVRALDRLKRHAQAVGEGRLGHRAEVGGFLEFGQLADSFNHMAAQLQEQRAAEERALSELTRANQELDAFAYSTSHDLRGPLRAIDGFSQALLEDYVDVLDDQAKDYLRRVRSASQRMGQLIDDLLKLSRVTRAEMKSERVDLSKVAEGIAADLRDSQPDRNVDFVIQKDLIVNGDHNLLRVALTNLFDNSWKFTRNRAQSLIEFGAVELAQGRAYFIKDNGAGFDMTYAGRLFGAFQRLHSNNEFPGTGIGLATVQRIIHRHGGRIWAEAEVGKGATFYFTL